MIAMVKANSFDRTELPRENHCVPTGPIYRSKRPPATSWGRFKRLLGSTQPRTKHLACLAALRKAQGMLGADNPTPPTQPHQQQKGQQQPAKADRPRPRAHPPQHPATSHTNAHGRNTTHFNSWGQVTDRQGESAERKQHRAQRCASTGHTAGPASTPCQSASHPPSRGRGRPPPPVLTEPQPAPSPPPLEPRRGGRRLSSMRGLSVDSPHRMCMVGQHTVLKLDAGKESKGIYASG